MTEKVYEEKTRELIIKRDNLFKSSVLGKVYNPKEDFICRSVLSLYNMCIDSDQYLEPNKDNPYIECKKAISVKKVLPIEDLRRTHPEIILFEGLYLVVNGIAMTYDFYAEQISKNKYLDKCVLSDKYSYGTMVNVGGSYLFALSKEESISKYIYNSKGYEVVRL